jgi:hypothetical protein
LESRAGKSPPEYWRNLGSSKTRTKEQEIKGRDLILQKITETTDNTAIAFTDGSCLNNPGPCGAGAIVFVIFVSFFISSPCKHINPNGDICLSVFSFLLHLSSWFLIGIFAEYE